MSLPEQTERPSASGTFASIDNGASRIAAPAWLVSVLLDGTIAVAVYFAAYLLRFQNTLVDQFLPGALAALPFVVLGQLAGLAVAGAYAPGPRLNWMPRVVAGVVAGTAAGAMVLGAMRGFAGISRAALAVTAMLFSVAAFGWRGVWIVRARTRAQAAPKSSDGELVDRAAEMTTPAAVLMSLYSYRELLKNLVLKDLKLKYRGSVFGFLWSLLNPLLMIAVYTIAFTFILRVRGEGFVFYLMLGQLSWTLFSSSASMSTGAIIDNSGLLKSVIFPRAILPIATVLFNLAQYLLTVSVFLPVMMLWYHVPLSSPMLLFPAFLALQVIFTIGVAFLLSTVTAFFRDVKHLVDVGLAVLFWTAPIVYKLDQVPERMQLLILLSPVSPFIVAYEQMFFYRTWPTEAVWLAAIAHATGAFVVGAYLFLTFENRFTEQL